MQTRTLKNGEFSYNEEKNTFTITDKDGNKVTLTKVYAYAFQRFLVSISQKWKPLTRKVQKVKAKKPNKAEAKVEEDDPRQQFLNFDNAER
jgi:tRNA G10  N-methylase Trm11